jgi:hypothetical protein
MRAAFMQYPALLQGGRFNREQWRSKWPMPVLVFSGAKGIPHKQICASVDRMGVSFDADIVPDAAPSFVHGNHVGSRSD